MNRRTAIAVSTLALLLLASVHASAAEEVVITCINQTDRLVKFEIWNRRPKFRDSVVLTGPFDNEEGLPWIDSATTELEKYKIKAFVWNEVIEDWVGKSKWLYFHNNDGDIAVELIKTNNGTSYLLREAAVPASD